MVIDNIRAPFPRKSLDELLRRVQGDFAALNIRFRLSLLRFGRKLVPKLCFLRVNF